MKKAEKRQSEINGETYKTNVTSQDERNFWKIKHQRKRFQNFRQIGSKSTNHSPLARRKEGQKVTLSLVAVTRKTDGNFENVSAGV